MILLRVTTSSTNIFHSYMFVCFLKKTHKCKFSVASGLKQFLKFKPTGKILIVNGETNCAACETDANVLLSLCTLWPGACEGAAGHVSFVRQD